MAEESFDNWVNALKNFPLEFQDIMLTHAIKHIQNPERKNKYVLQLSPVALTTVYGTMMNQPNEMNRLGKLYDMEVIKGTSDAVGHEPSASGKGYWVHIPRIAEKDTRGNINTAISEEEYQEFKKLAEEQGHKEQFDDESGESGFKLDDGSIYKEFRQYQNIRNIFVTKEQFGPYVKFEYGQDSSAQHKVNVELS